MFRIKQIIIFLLFAAQVLRAQDNTDFRYHDSLTYKLYTDKNWNELISAAKKALHDGHDYYYLRMRIGIAYYEKKQYASAATHFRKAGE
ncbi:MAG: hypothetical protein MUD02_08815, partial [Bacteroidales bacterium]|nr:hypothetical protein [Bacteroidales bacterium]